MLDKKRNFFLFNFREMSYSQDFDQIYDFSKYTDLQKDQFIEEIFKEQREIGENIPDFDMRSFFYSN